ncbi:MAG: AraC family transcriptional regulator [Oscillospiraceae bacterium]
MDKGNGGIRFEFDNVFRFNPQNYEGLLLYQIGELCCESGYEISSHKQWCNEISYIVSGSGTFYCNGTQYSVKSGDVFISPLGVTHAVKASGTEQLRFAYIGFDFTHERQIEVYQTLKNFFESVSFYLVSDMQEIMTPFYKVIDEFYKKSQYGEVMIQGYIIQILIMTYRAFSVEKTGQYRSDSKQKFVGPTVYSVMKYIDTNLFNNISVGQIAKDLGYNDCYLSHIFKEKTGQTLQNYVIQKKIWKSIEIFKLGNCSISDISARLGYANVQSFSRAFKKLTGVYPSQYIEKYCRQ